MLRLLANTFRRRVGSPLVPLGAAGRHSLVTAISPRASSINMPDEDFISIEAALQVVEKFASRLTVGDAEGHVRRSVDELCAAVTKKEGIEPAVDRLLRSLRGLDDAGAATRRRDFGRESPAVDRFLDAVQEELLPALRRVGYQV